MKKIFLLFILQSLFQHASFSQDQHLVDSLETQLKNHNAHKLELGKNVPAMYDTMAANILHELLKAYLYNTPDKAMDNARQELEISEEIGYKKGIANAYGAMAVIDRNKGDYMPALDLNKKALKIRLETADKQGIAKSYNNIGEIYRLQGNYPEALKNHFTALKIREEIGDKQGIADSYNNIGIVYYLQGNYPEAVKNYFAALKIREEIGDKNGIADSYSSIGLIYLNQGNYQEALKNYFAALKIYEETGEKYAITTSYQLIGNIYLNQGNINEALKNHFTALKIEEEIGDKDNIASSYINIGAIYTKLKKYTNASGHLNKALSLSKEIGNLDDIKDSHDALAQLDSAQGNFKQALEHYKLFIAARDSLLNNENTKKITQQQMQFDFNKKQVADSLNFAQEKEIGEVKLQKQKALTYGGFAGIVITIILLFFVYRNYNKQRIANQQLKEAQQQLIKSEKMAAFGVMASRVSHEIQNPLNFVNNFSELSKDLAHEIVNAKSEEEKKDAVNSLVNNLEKINEHGKRATTIINQLQEHSRKGSAHEFFEEK